MTPPPLQALVVALARKVLRECRTCDGRGSTIQWVPYQLTGNGPCPTCGDVRRALAEWEKEEGGT